jgi:hypothetical protein
MVRKNIRRILIIWIALMAITALVGKTSIASDDKGVSADFLNIGVGAREAGMGEAYTSLAEGPSAIFWNPAGLAFGENIQFSFSHFEWMQDISYDFFAAAYPLSDRIGIGAGVQYLDYGKIDGYDGNDNPTGEIGGTYDLAATASLGYRISDHLSFGLSGKYIMISLADIGASAMAADIAIRYSDSKLMVGISAANLGGNLKFEIDENRLPANIRLGMAIMSLGGRATISTEIKKELYGAASLKNGLEYNFDKRYFLRTGYGFSSENSAGFDNGLTLGVGAILGPSQIDYSFTPYSRFSSETIHRFSIGLRIDK